MEKKYYFRGLGLGIIVTALIMGISLSHGEKREMTDAEIIARAKELGMTENTRLLEPSETAEDAENQEETEPSAKKETVGEPVKKDVAVAQPKDDKESSDEEPAAQTEQQEKPAAQEDEASDSTAQNQKPVTGTNEMTKQDEDTGQENPPPAEESGNEPPQKTESTVSITIVSGDGSYTVAKKLEEAGVVFSASDYDDYLCQNGYDKRLRTGTFQIPAGASNEQIARIVTGQP